MPRTGRPPWAAGTSASMTGAKREIAPAAQVVAVGEAAGQDDGVHPVQVGVAVPERDGDAAGDPDRAPGVVVVQRAGEGHHPDPHALRLRRVHRDDVLDHGVGQQLLGGLAGGGEHLVGDLAVHGQDEALALPHVGELVEPQPRQGAGDGLPLRVENLGLEHDVDDDVSHARCSSRGRGARPAGGSGACGQPSLSARRSPSVTASMRLVEVGGGAHLPGRDDLHQRPAVLDDARPAAPRRAAARWRTARGTRPGAGRSPAAPASG